MLAGATYSMPGMLFRIPLLFPSVRVRILASRCLIFSSRLSMRSRSSSHCFASHISHKTEKSGGDLKLRLNDKVALVTGAASGIGFETARLFAAEGAKVAIFDKSAGAKDAASTIKSTGGDAIAIEGDVINPRDVEEGLQETVKRFGALDVLVNNAGNFLIRDILDTSVQDWDAIVDVNLKGTFFCSKFAVQQMLRQGRGGSIVNIGSDLAVVGHAGCTAYCASKAAVVNFTRALALECAKDGIRVNCVCPASIETPLFLEKNLKMAADRVGYEKARQSLLACLPIGRFGKALDVARAVLYIASDEASYVTGAILMCDGGRTCY
jgi:NAD(P)-dependent dehydrogenase (short-subunit alcohol dehydrogenase family)